MYIFLIIIAVIVAIGIIFLNQPKFGKNPRAERLARIEKSKNYKDGTISKSIRNTSTYF